MLINAQEIGSPEFAPPDVVIVGAGAVGLTMGTSLARAGRRVLLLEAGPEHLAAHSQQLFEVAESTGRAHLGLTHGRFRMLGGTSNFWGGQLVPLGEHVFRARPWLNEATAWPITGRDLAPYYEAVFELLGMANVVPTDDAILARFGATLPALGPELKYFYSRWAPQPNLAVLFDRDLRSSKNLICVTGAQAVALEMQGQRVSALEFVDTMGKRHKVQTPRLILANGTVEIVRLLLAKLANDEPGPWSGNRWLGSGFMDHLDITAGRIRIINKRAFSDAFENIILDGIKYQPKIRLSSEAQIGKYVDIGAHLIFNSTYEAHYENAKIFLRSFLRGRFDGSVKSYLKNFLSLVRFGMPMVLRYLRSNRIAIMADNGIELRFTAEQCFVGDSRLRLIARHDALGLPIVALDWRVDGREIETMAHFAETLERSFRTSGIAEINIDPRLLARDPDFLKGARDSNHHMGMARMGATPDDGVVDRDLRVFGTSNLFVAGAAVYPSTGFPNPTFAAMALGLRLCDHLLQGT